MTQITYADLRAAFDRIKREPLRPSIDVVHPLAFCPQHGHRVLCPKGCEHR
jgi:hypothetical protein